MDQQAFRQLLSKSGRASGSGSAEGGSSSKRAFGLQNKRSAGGSSSSATASSVQPSDLRPRKIKDKEERKPRPPATNSTTGESYVDRASARREGKESEFADVEKLYAEFQQRADRAENEEERQLLQEQIKYLGGDEKHSVLVKGLDFALLAQNKAKLAAAEGSNADDDLEAAFQASNQPSAHESKKDRDSIIEALKQRRTAAAPALAKKADAGLPSSKFKPIGFKPIGTGTSAAKADEPEFKYVNGKRMRKKKKKLGPEEAQSLTLTSEAPPRQASTLRVESQATQTPEKAPTPKESSSEPKHQEQSAIDASPQHEKSEPDQAPAKAPASPPKQPDATPAVPDEDEDEDEDIFADVGGWDGIPEGDDDDDNGEGDSKASKAGDDDAKAEPPALAPGQKRNWFSSGHATATDRDNEASLPSELSAIVAQAGTTSEVKSQPVEQEPMQTRLQGFSDSALPSDLGKMLLERESGDRPRSRWQDHDSDDDNDGRKKRRRRNRKKGGSGGGGGDSD